MEPLTLDISPLGSLSDDDLYRLCRDNPDLWIERTEGGLLEIMAPAGGMSSARSGRVFAALFNWNERDGSGIVFDASGGFLLPGGSMRAPDAAWVARERWAQLSDEEREKFPPLCPDVVAEVMSPPDRPVRTHAKMREWIRNGCRLAWLLCPAEEVAYVYRPDQNEPDAVPFDAVLTGEDVLPGFTFALNTLR